mmetsp:Transcript_10237/g.23083  ORF Transcript_10237/g.23083 Transcript_10237/m.23083 type:complete len:355 (-) Transcript_10237:111-1175(-)
MGAKEKKKDAPLVTRLRLALLRCIQSQGCQKFCARCKDARRCIQLVMMKVLGPCFVTAAHLLIGNVTFTYLVYVLPQIESLGIVGKLLLTLVGATLLINILYNYFFAITLDAGRPPDYSQQLTESAEAGQKPFKKCAKCGLSKPPRAHHCSVCRRCILKMDHHCPWVNNCVGYGNYRYFCLFMLWMALGSIFVFIVFIPQFLDDDGAPGNQHRTSLYALNVRLLRMTTTDAGKLLFSCCRMTVDEPRVCIVFSVLCAGFALLITGGLGILHTYLVIVNKSTIEFQADPWNRLSTSSSWSDGEYCRNSYNVGRSRNFQQVFGPNPFWEFRWLFPYLAKPPVGTGLDFPSLAGINS